MNKLAMVKHTEPFPWYEVPNALNVNERKALIDSYPQTEFTCCENNEGDKPYKMYLRQAYHSNNNDQLHTFSDPWQAFLAQLVSIEYRHQLETELNLDLSHCDIELNLWKYKHGCYLAPHLDKDNKFLTQLFYFNESWDPSWGGALRLLNSDKLDDVGVELFPDTTSSVVFQQSHLSWHAVTKQLSNDEHSRNIVQLIYWQRDHV